MLQNKTVVQMLPVSVIQLLNFQTSAIIFQAILQLFYRNEKKLATSKIPIIWLVLQPCKYDVMAIS